MKARGKIRRYLIAFGKIQHLAGVASVIYLNDRTPDRADKLLPVLDEIFNICLTIRGEYDPITEKAQEVVK